MTKNKLMHLETLTQNILGMIIAMIILRCWGLSFNESVALQAIFFVTSYIRGYCVRRVFDYFSTRN